jgi:hypothetical protein
MTTAGRREPSLHGGDVPVAARCADVPAPPGATLVLFGADGQARRPAAFNGRPAAPGKGEAAWWFVPGPHAVEQVPFAGAPEVGLRVSLVVDAPDPRLQRQRFDLFLFSEVAGQAGSLSLPELAGRIETALRAALQGGTLDLPPCTSLEEWHAFRAGLDELLYMRFGVTVDDCVPALLDDVDFAAMLRRRADAAAPAPASMPAAPPAPPPALQPDDAAALRRLFLELPDASRALRMLPMPDFSLRQAQLQRLALAALDVNTMPALALAAPGRARPASARQRLSACSAAAARALDERWAVQARMKAVGKDGARGKGGADELDRIVANLEFHLAARRGGGADAFDARREPVL